MKHEALQRYLRHGMLTQLWVFDAVARHGNFTHAGRELNLAQPTVSILMKKLSTSLGLPLFRHCRHSVELTEAGRELHQSVLKIFADLGRLEARLRPFREPSPARASTPPPPKPRTPGAPGKWHPS